MCTHLGTCEVLVDVSYRFQAKCCDEGSVNELVIIIPGL
jgi:hypothetical protein